MRVRIGQNNYGHWKCSVARDDGGQETSPSFLTRDGAINFARAQWPSLDIVSDGETRNTEPPPLPKIDPVAEARRAGIPVVQ